MMRIEIHLLGSVEALRDDAPIALFGARQRRLLAVLALRAGHLVGVHEIIDAVWPEGPLPPDARETLHTYVSRLRRSFGDPTLVCGRDNGYLLAVESKCVDALRFVDLLERSRSSATPETLLSEAIELWHGPALGGFDHEPWARPDAVRLEEMRALALDELARRLLAVGEPYEVLATLEAAVLRNPLREQTHLLLIQALYDCGRTADALRTGHDYRERSITQTGIEPSLAMRDLVRTIALAPGKSPLLGVGR
jgi:DNA-binding SARP family transcriptional activator